MLEHALQYLKLGYSVIPVKAARKGGALLQWKRYQQEQPTEQQVREWLTPPTRATGVAIVTGTISSCVVLDFDTHGEDDGERVARELYGWEIEGPAVRTGGGGLHAYYAHPGGTVPNVIGLEPGIDLKGDGGFVYAPPSLHPSGERYEWIEELAAPDELPPLPQWVRDKIKAMPNAEPEQPQTDIERVLQSGVAEGTRNDTAARIAGYFLAQGVQKAGVRLILQGWNARNHPPLPEDELEKVLDSIDRKERAKRGEDVEGLDRDVALQAIGEALHVPLEDVMRIGGSSPRYRFVFNGRYADVAGRDIGSQWSWQREIIALTAQVPRTLKRPQWEEILQRMLKLAREIEPGEEATERGELRAWLQSYFEALPIREEDEESSQPEDPRKVNDDTCIHVGHLRRYVRGRFDVRVEHKALVQQLTAFGFERQTVNVVLSKGKRTTRSMWIVPSEFLPGKETSDA